MLNSIFQKTKYFREIGTIMEEEFFYARQYLNCSLINKSTVPDDFEIITLEVNFSKSKWVAIGNYKFISLNDITFISGEKKILTYHESS